VIAGILLVLAISSTFAASSKDFVTVNGTNFELDGKTYHFCGTNYWHGMNLGAPDKGNQTRLREELDQLQAKGLKNLRIMGNTQGPNGKPKRIDPALEYDKGKFAEDIFKGLDIFLYEMGKRDMKAVVTLNNFWEWSGGFPQYFEWFKGRYNLYPTGTYGEKDLTDHLKDFITLIINRKNWAYQEYEGKTVLYKDDPAIMAWQLANEPRAGDCNVWKSWIEDTAKHIKHLDPNHLVSIGNEGTITGCSSHGNEVPEVDYVTFHAWAQNWGWYSPRSRSGLDRGIQRAQSYIDQNVDLNFKYKKPMVLEEFGLARNGNSYDPDSSSSIRDEYFEGVFEHVYKHAQNGKMSGVNFWAYGGQGRPRENGGWWKAGDDFIGDPPHEKQGWYSIYNTDGFTLDMLKNWADKFDALNE
jgi:mannan endo-1,4-beta-mannosidase